MRPVGMFVHGLNLYDPEWRDIVWGKPPHLLGRATKAVRLLKDAYRSAEAIIFGSGATERDGEKEAEYTIRFLLENWDDLRQFDAFKNASWLAMRSLRGRFERTVSADLHPHNTYAELECSIPRLYSLGCTRIVVVTDATHISRSLAYGGEVLWKNGLFGKVSLIGEHSDVRPSALSPDEIVVFEPRACGQRAIAPNLRRIFRLPADKRGEFNDKFAELLTSLGA